MGFQSLFCLQSYLGRLRVKPKPRRPPAQALIGLVGMQKDPCRCDGP
jgi:hypothetical protein